MRGMLDGTEPSAAGPHYAAGDRPGTCPAPIQPHLPILVGGGGERVTLKLVAQYADACNVGGGIESVRRKDAILREHCQTVGRDEGEIERTTAIGTVFIRDDRAEAERLFRAAFERNKVANLWTDQPVGTPEDVAERLAPYLELGFRHFVAGMPATYDEESMTRLISEVKPILERGGMTMSTDRRRRRRRLLGTGPDRPVRADRERPPRSIGRSTATRWSTVEDLGGTLASAPAVTAWAVDRMEVFAVFAGRPALGSLLGRRELAPVGVARRRARPDRRLRGFVVGTGPARRLRSAAATAGSGTAGGTARAGSTGSGSDKSQLTARR